MEEIEVALSERPQFADAKTAERREQNHGAIPRFDRIGDREDLLDGCDGAFLGPLYRCPLDHTRVAQEEAVLERSRADGVQ
ncbi:MAG: hypothetical protein ACR2LO_06795 [Ilumatobacteraceae bacterium]|jgi:hypothetical protein